MRGNYRGREGFTNRRQPPCARRRQLQQPGSQALLAAIPAGDAYGRQRPPSWGPGVRITVGLCEGATPVRYPTTIDGCEKGVPLPLWQGESPAGGGESGKGGGVGGLGGEADLLLVLNRANGCPTQAGCCISQRASAEPRCSCAGARVLSAPGTSDCVQAPSRNPATPVAVAAAACCAACCCSGYSG